MSLFSDSDKTKSFLWIVSFLVAYAGLVGFTCFIFEESLQLQSFAAYIYVNAEDWNGLEEHIKLMEKTQRVAEIWIKGVGWSNPIMWPAFLSYLESNEAYINTLKRKIELEKK
ncbi:MAG: hypothetical protein QF567_03030 [Candidatus Pacearchaeota archaeon]|jgi:hypothetical protein|nr:hypothetical protein [Candidatus Pacearchaeota archaeon]MDP7521183.1 hypothetical protein [Candidatus Pacearchaeota archaeon]|tara:strand:- start:480 stop:818 length:339 start_codon:yes stop_codon:yes gene_type:complete